jgi:hypothetical protein
MGILAEWVAKVYAGRGDAATFALAGTRPNLQSPRTT